ncbi:hypothetical protein Goari_014084 [Gossypium aridum]|uniref:Uncharacterized protein n=1 Tax=Gossypium aridum TaxID=34290 RepID=A0A7J8XHV2_GOSAI|nr:hypothetical protein [Gossypium aridum]
MSIDELHQAEDHGESGAQQPKDKATEEKKGSHVENCKGLEENSQMSDEQEKHRIEDVKSNVRLQLLGEAIGKIRYAFPPDSPGQPPNGSLVGCNVITARFRSAPITPIGYNSHPPFSAD